MRKHRRDPAESQPHPPGAAAAAAVAHQPVDQRKMRGELDEGEGEEHEEDAQHVEHEPLIVLGAAHQHPAHEIGAEQHQRLVDDEDDPAAAVGVVDRHPEPEHVQRHEDVEPDDADVGQADEVEEGRDDADDQHAVIGVELQAGEVEAERQDQRHQEDRQHPRRGQAGDPRPAAVPDRAALGEPPGPGRRRGRRRGIATGHRLRGWARRRTRRRATPGPLAPRRPGGGEGGGLVNHLRDLEPDGPQAAARRRQRGELHPALPASIGERRVPGQCRHGGGGHHVGPIAADAAFFARAGSLA